MVDEWVKNTQQWVNTRYHAVHGYVRCAEDGHTGWSTVNSLLLGLQHELGMKELVANFGPSTTAGARKIAPIGSGSPVNVIKIMQGALYCKGYDGSGLSGHWDARTIAAVKKVEHDAGIPETGTVSVKLLRGLLSMDAYVELPGGSFSARQVQRWLNATYLGHNGFDLSPCDGYYTRGVQQAFIRGVQYELGISDENATGNFGEGTRAGLKKPIAHARIGSEDTTHRFVHLFKAGLIFNGQPVGFTGRFTDADTQSTRRFQEFAALPAADRNGEANYRTWASLLVSCGDPDRPAEAADMATQLDLAKAKALHDAGYRIVGRYLTVDTKRFNPGELDAIFAAGLTVFPIFQENGTELANFSAALGYDNGYQAVRRARQLGFATGTTIYFSVDLDATDEQITTRIIPHFEGIKKAVDESINMRYQVGIYATRNVCARVATKGLASSSFVSGMSWGFSGNLGYRLPDNWAYDQFANTHVGGFEIDKNVVSPRAHPATRTQVATSPVLHYGGKTHHDEEFLWRFAELCYQADIAAHGSKIIGHDVVTDIVLQWLQKDKYWSDIFQLYTPLTENAPGIHNTPGAHIVADARERFSKQSHIAPSSSHYPGDIPHLSVTIRGYTTWGVPEKVPDVHTGDLGGWALDLVTCWDEYVAARRAARPYSKGVASWIQERVGGSTGSFGSADLVADVDAYLIARLVHGPHGKSLTEAVRELRAHSTASASWRYHEFYTHRFGSTDSIVNAVTSLLRVPQSFPEEEIKGRIIRRFLTHGRWPGQSDPKIDIPTSERSRELHDLAMAFAGVIRSRAGIGHG